MWDCRCTRTLAYIFIFIHRGWEMQSMYSTKTTSKKNLNLNLRKTRYMYIQIYNYIHKFQICWTLSWKTFKHAMTTKLPYRNPETPLFRYQRFMLDEMHLQNASKCAIFLEYKNPCSFFSFFISCYCRSMLTKALIRGKTK